MWTLIGLFVFMLIVLANLHSGADPAEVMWDGEEDWDDPTDPEDSTKRVEARLNGKS